MHHIGAPAHKLKHRDAWSNRRKLSLQLRPAVENCQKRMKAGFCKRHGNPIVVTVGQLRADMLVEALAAPATLSPTCQSLGLVKLRVPRTLNVVTLAFTPAGMVWRNRYICMYICMY